MLQYVINQYGKERVVSLGSFQYIRAKGTIKDIGRVLNIPFEVTNEMTYQLGDLSIGKALDLGLLDEYKSKYPELFEYAQRLAGLPKSFSAHPCGKVCSMNDITYYNATDTNDEGLVILQGDMHTADDLGLIKADFLGLRTVDVIYDTLEMIGKDYEYIAPHSLNFNDEKVLSNFRNGFTSGIFQFESSGMQDTLSKIECNSIYDLTVANALYRPGSIKYIDNYAARRKGIEQYSFLHPDLEPILKDSYGIIVFQEQLIEIGRLAKLSNPDELRKATAKKKAELLNKIKPELVGGLKNRGWLEDQVNQLWESMLDFAKYSFNKCISGNTKFYKPSNRKGVRNPSVEEMYKITHDLDFAKHNNYLPLRSKYLKSGYGKALSMFSDGKIRINTIVNIQPSGIRKVYKVTTQSGKWIECTDNHKFPTPNGEKKLYELQIGDSLFVLGTYEREQYNYNFTNGIFKKNIPSHGQMGFQKIPNGESVKFFNYRNQCIKNHCPCEICGKPYNENTRFELHHNNKDRHNNEPYNLTWCCVSCHKKLDYALGRNKTYQKGINATEDKIVSIEYVGEEMTYDVTMADPAHNFVVDNGLITSNSHAAAYAITAYICMYLKTYHPKEFLCAWINSVSNKIEKVAECIAEAKRLGVKIYLGRYNNCSPDTKLYKDGIIVGTDTIKHCNKEIADELMNLFGDKSKIQDRSFIEVLDMLAKANINVRQLNALILLNFFSDFGKSKYLLSLLQLYDGIKLKGKTVLPSFRTCKQINKDKIESYSDYGITEYLLKKYSAQETPKRYSDLDNIGLLNELSERLSNSIEDFNIQEKIKAEIELLGYTLYSNPTIPDNYYIVTAFKTFSDELRPMITLRILKTGKEIKTRIKNPRVFQTNPFKLFSILQIEGFTWAFKKRKINDKWESTDETEPILELYSVLKI